jgi:hypothetical protein
MDARTHDRYTLSLFLRRVVLFEGLELCILPGGVNRQVYIGSRYMSIFASARFCSLYKHDEMTKSCFCYVLGKPCLESIQVIFDTNTAYVVQDHPVLDPADEIRPDLSSCYHTSK